MAFIDQNAGQGGALIQYRGWVYEITSEPSDQLYGTVEYVIKYNPNRHFVGNPIEEIPLWVVYRGHAFAATTIDVASVEHLAVKVVSADNPLFEYPEPGMFTTLVLGGSNSTESVSTSSTAFQANPWPMRPLPGPHGRHIHRSLPPTSQPSTQPGRQLMQPPAQVPTEPQPPQVAPTYDSPHPMPYRATMVTKAALPYLYDLPAHLHAVARATMTEPAPQKPDESSQDCRQRLDAAQRLVRDELLERALLVLNRPLRYGDFRAVTEALNRRLEGTLGPNGRVYRPKGFNTVDSHVRKADWWSGFVARVLP
ncbi:hypothetical protein LZ554_000478 [Drepanopeziza brunnea f. sp. 'monogermtubi']|nr:hypothetical protein LZ554_000478 [Drepanopeziza brunnea f. sp. 'monogermtubi']